MGIGEMVVYRAHGCTAHQIERSPDALTWSSLVRETGGDGSAMGWSWTWVLTLSGKRRRERRIQVRQVDLAILLPSGHATLHY